ASTSWSGACPRNRSPTTRGARASACSRPSGCWPRTWITTRSRRPSPHQVGGDVVLDRGVRVDPERDAGGEDRRGFVQRRHVHQQVAPVELDHAELAGVERLELRLGDVDALDLAAVLEMPRDLRLRVVQRLALQERGQLRARLAPLARGFLLAALGLDPLFLLLLRADRIGLGQVDVAVRPRLARRARGRLRCRARRLALALPFGLAGGLGLRLEAEAK